MIIKGKHAVIEALKQQPSQILRIVFSNGIKQQDRVKEIHHLAQMHGINIRYIDKRVFEREYEDNNTQHVVAHCKGIPHLDLKEVLNNIDKYQKIVILDHIEDPFNFGAILRSSAAFGIDAVIYSKHRQSSINAGVIKASSGAVYHVPLVCVSNIAQAIQQLNKSGYWVYGTDVNTGTELHHFQANNPYALIVGNEKKGISKALSKHLHDTIKISMHGKIESLNVSVATGILLYELTRVK